jgi:hypothetical protein
MMRSSLPEEYYEYRPHGRNWVVYRIRRDATGSTGTKIGEFLTKEEARRKVYQLNGWDYKEKEYEQKAEWSTDNGTPLRNRT